MKKYISVFFILSILFAGCGPQDDKTQEEKTETTSKDKKEEKSKAEKAKEKIAENKKSKKSNKEKLTEEKTSEEVEKLATQEAATTELQTTEPTTVQGPVTQEPVTQEPATQEQVQNNQSTEQQRIDFCKDIRGGIPEACQTPAIIEAGNKKGAIERQASVDYDAGLITQEQYNQKLREATEIMNQAWLQEYGVNPGQ